MTPHVPRAIAVTAALLAAALTGAPTSAHAAPGATSAPAAPVLVGFDSTEAMEAAAATLAASGEPAVAQYGDGVDVLAVAADHPLLDQLAASPDVVAVEPDTEYRAAAEPPSWGIDRVDQRDLPLDKSYDPGTGGAGVTAYVIDSGLNFSHVEFTGRVPRSAYDPLDFTSADDCDGHGTHVAGTVAGSTAGVAPAAEIVPVKVIDCLGGTNLDSLLWAMSWVVNDHVAGVPAVANISISGPSSVLLSDAVDAMTDDGITVAIAAGNAPSSGGPFDACTRGPGNTPAAITVAASDINDVRPDWSNYGSCVDLFAPGAGIVSAWIGSPTAGAVLDGTSMASPHVAGAAARYLSVHPTATPAQVADALLATATPFAGSAMAGDPALLLYTSPSRFSAFDAPVRLFDTRAGNTGVLETVVDEATRFSPGEVRRYTPANALGVSGGAVLAVNVAAVRPDANGYLQVYPCASTAATPPAASFLNFTSAVTVANNGTVALDASGGFCVLSSNGTDVVVDSSGQLPLASFEPFAEPIRLVDSRAGRLGALEQPGGTVGADISVPLTPNVPWRFVVTGANGIPASPGALALGVAAVGPSGGGFLSIYPCDSVASPAPTSSTLNFVAGGTIANGTVVTPSASGGICVLASQATHVLLDATGWFPTGAFTPLAAPLRLVDSRAGRLGALEQPGGTVGADISVPLPASQTWRFVVTGANGIPTSVAGLAVNLTAVAPAGGGFVTIFPCASDTDTPPASSTLNVRAGVTIANGALVAPGAGGGVCVRASQSVHVLLDATGYVAA